MTTPSNAETPLCCILGCLKHVKKNDKFCSMHRARVSRTGRFSKKTSFERLMERCELRQDGCIEYTRYLNKWGYGRLRSNGKKMLAHRLAYENTYGPIPEGMMVCHKCDNPKCVRIDHLFLGTATDNVQDSIKKGRRDCVKIAKERWIKCPTFRKM